LTTGAVTFILDRLEEAGMVTRRRDTEDRRRVWVEIVPEAQQRLQRLQQPVADEMRQVASQFKVDELQVVHDFMRQAKEVFQRQVHGAVSEAVDETVDEVNTAMKEVHEAVNTAVNEAMHEVRKNVHGSGHGEPPGEEPGGRAG
jgi:DNA-binding MarR family transcriptional regulator